ncbi:MAG: 7-cyano-7-deazaguanine synthase QueC [Candidatus Omnitrophica bacterium]|nr:7-cyano-7-deazaguanine synthase QueC [Candidatus Omnitrophota bacterium]
MNKKAVVLLSGGLDSAVTLAVARRGGFNCHCLIFDYGQRHNKEIGSAKKVAQDLGSKYKLVKIELPWKGSSLLDEKVKLTESLQTKGRNEIPATYVPARNIIFLSCALSYAEAIGAKAIYIGAHQQDYSGYPDCRKEFFHAMKPVIAYGTRSGVQKNKIKILTPLLHKRKAEIIKIGNSLGVDFGLTWSCYRGLSVPCGKCDSCYYRKKGFIEAGLEDPLLNKPRRREKK